ncbi:unnamed protein product [Parnassius apollo]|uniref:(apollo) hypothetical protein n=1 Tax=Parnassius apollo TaxID=110799 RepID=A0A8S3XR16_PARAO|nr:unnamed protein product [Parnassius apollo]
MCPACKNKVPRTGDHSNTPVKCQEVGECSPLHKDIDIGLEIRLFRNELSAMRNELKEVRDNITMVKDTVLAFNKSLEERDCRVTKLEKLYEEYLIKCDTKILEDTISELRVQLNERDQDLLVNDLEISGLPERKGENPINTVVLCAKKMGLDIDHREIVMRRVLVFCVHLIVITKRSKTDVYWTPQDCGADESACSSGRVPTLCAGATQHNK